MKLKATRKTRVRVVLTLSGLLAVVCLLVLSSSDEPEYQGRELSRWLNELAHSDSPVDADKPIPAREALREMGTKVIPHLLKRLRFRDSFAKRNLVRLALRAGFIDIERYTREEYLFKREGYYHATAANGFRLLGPKAVSALPDLVSLMNQGGSSGWSAAYAIAGIGPEAVRPITQALTNQNPEVRASAVFALTGLYQADSSAAVPFLTELLNDADQRIRGLSADALGQICKRPDLAVPALANRLEDADFYTGLRCLNALAKFGSQANAAMPVVSKLATDKKHPLSGTARNVLKQIAPETAHK